MVTGLTGSQDQSSQERLQCAPRLHTPKRAFPFRVAIYIDGCNFYYGLRSIDPWYSDVHFDFKKYVDYLVGERQVVLVRYYNASLKQRVNKESFDKQQMLFKRLRSLPLWHVVLCRRQKRQQSGEIYYQVKGDDIHLAIDLLRDAYEDRYDVAILISGDGDFEPVVRYVKEKGKRVENVHFEQLASRSLLATCQHATIIDKKIANKYFYRRTVPEV